MRVKCAGSPGRGNIPVWEEVDCKWKVRPFIYRRCQNSTLYKSKTIRSLSFSSTSTSLKWLSLPPTTSSLPLSTTIIANPYLDKTLLVSWLPSGLLDLRPLRPPGQRLLTLFLKSGIKTFLFSTEGTSPSTNLLLRYLGLFLKESFRLAMWVPSATAGRKIAPTMKILYAPFYLAF